MTREDQLTVQMPDGMVIERLPVGHAAGAWWFTFVLTGFDRRRVMGPKFHGDLQSTISLSGPNGEPLDFVSGGSGGSDSVFRYDVSYRDSGLSEVSVTYRQEGHEHAHEHLNLLK